MLDFLAQTIQVLRDALSTRQHGASVRREGGPARRARDQRDAQGRLQLLQGLAQRRLRHPQVARGRTHAAVLGDGDQGPKMLQFH